MKILCVGDIVGTPGVDFFCEQIPRLKYDMGADFIIANAENSDEGGVGLSKNTVDRLLQYADVLTSGNHAFRKCDEAVFAENHPHLLHPANFPGGAAAGNCLIDTGRFGSLQIINLQGTAFLPPLDNPFSTADMLIKNSSAKFIIVDFHAESTAEKKALAFYLDGRASAVFGTHTHVQTADEQILPNGTGYISDVGMVGPAISVLGVEPELAVKRQSTQRPVRFKVAGGACLLGAVLFELDDKTGRCIATERINLRPD